MNTSERAVVPFNLRQRAGALRRQIEDLRLRARALDERIASKEQEACEIERELVQWVEEQGA